MKNMNISKMFDRIKCRIGLHEWGEPYRIVYEKLAPTTTPIAEGQPMKVEKLSWHKKSVDMGPGWAMCGRCGKKKLTKYNLDNLKIQSLEQELERFEEDYQAWKRKELRMRKEIIELECSLARAEENSDRYKAMYEETEAMGKTRERLSSTCQCATEGERRGRRERDTLADCRAASRHFPGGIMIGEYTIRTTETTGLASHLWIDNGEGEGMVVAKTKLEEYLRQFWINEF